MDTIVTDFNDSFMVRSSGIPLQLREVIAESALRIAPVPSRTVVTIGRSDGLPMDRLQIFDPMGRPVLDHSDLDPSVEIDVSMFPCGVYWVQVPVLGKTVRSKFMVAY
jgi:hypothetical protein